jgi:N-acetylated-alpha-linked acidic dipeptidase
LHQDTVERRLHQLVSADSISRLHRPLTRRPHPAGSAGAREVVTVLERTLRGFGLEVERHEYRAWLSYPRRVRVALVSPVRRQLSVREPPLKADPTSGHGELGEGYVAYSASGDVTAPVIYANYGLPADYAELQRLGVAVSGRVVLVRYGRSHRAVKVHSAQQAGARAVILYSDPADDGFRRGPEWPEGYWRGPGMLQRGNAKLSWYFHGDPLTPAVAATERADRLDPQTAPTLPAIPVVAIGWGEARHILASLGGPAAPPAFTGGIALPYRLGPGTTAVRVAVQMDNGLRTITNVVARVPGASQPDRMILLGGHHDAWTFGGVDPGTGAAALLEVARVLGQLRREGHRPARTIALAFWDAEEFGLIGSTEYAEQLRRELQERLMMYINTDMNMRGRFDPGGVPSLRDFVVDVARDVPDRPTAAGQPYTVYERWVGDTLSAPPAARPLPQLKALGSGADFVPFQDHVGTPTLSIEFIGANGYGFGAYHTNYDSRAYAERVADPGFVQGAVLARTLGTMALRVANADLLPFRFGPYADALASAITEAARALGSAAPEESARVVAALAPRAERVKGSARAVDRALEGRAGNGPIPEEIRRAINDRLARIEQTLTDDDGPPDRSWYRHVVFGWNIYSLYDGQPLPGLAEATRTGDRAQIGREVARVERALDRMATALDAVTLLLGEKPR